MSYQVCTKRKQRTTINTIGGRCSLGKHEQKKKKKKKISAVQFITRMF